MERIQFVSDLVYNEYDKKTKLVNINLATVSDILQDSVEELKYLLEIAKKQQYDLEDENKKLQERIAELEKGIAV